MMGFGVLFVVAFVCAGLGLTLGVAAVFRIIASRGQRRGYGHATLAIVFSILTMVGFATVLFMVGSRAPSSEEIAPAYRELIDVEPPAEWFRGSRRQIQLAGLAAGMSGSEEINQIMNRASIPGVTPSHVMEMTIRHEKDRATGVEIVIWFASLDGPPTHDRTRFNRNELTAYLAKERRTVVGVMCEKPEVGSRLGEFYARQVNRIPASRK